MNLPSTLLALGFTLFGLTQPAAAAEAKKDFVWYCESDEATEAQKETVATIYEIMNLAPDKVGCQEAFDIIRAKEYLEINFFGHTLSDLSPLRGLDNLSSIACQNFCNANVINTIPALPHLESFESNFSGLTEIPNLSRFKKLKYLTLSGHPISQVTSTHGIEGLENLNMPYTELKDVAFIAKLPNLKQLNLSGSKSTKYDSFPTLPNLKTLILENMDIVNCDFLEKFRNLNSLVINDNKLSSLDCLDANTKLYAVEAADNQITGNYIKLPPSIGYLDLSKNPIETFEFLKGKKELGSLNLYKTGLTQWGEIKPLKDHIKWLDISGNQIAENIIPSGSTEEWPRLKELNIAYTSIKSLAFFKQMATPELKVFLPVDIESKTEENCPTSGVPEVVAEFCKQ